MPGTWAAMPTICSSRRLLGYRACTSWADEGSNQCSQWADQGHNECSQWADEGHNDCDSWSDHGHEECCDWAPCSWFCDAFYWVANWVCNAWYWVANWVCQAWYWVANWVCQAWYWVAKWVCLFWTWIFFVFCFSGDGGAAFVLTDGSILLNESASGYGTKRWWKLVPDASGNYTGGIWQRVADSSNGRKYFASAVLADGRLVVCGGEYSDVSGSNQQDETNLCSIYDPVADNWTNFAGPAGVAQIGDAACAVLPAGQLLMQTLNSRTIFLMNPTTLAWTASANLKGSNPAEESWVLMPESTVLTVQTNSTPNAEKYVIASDQWVSAGALAANIVETASSEIGPGIVMPDARAFFVGAAGGNTAVYTAGPNATAAGTWVAGPAIPARGRQSQGSKDGPAALEAGGKVLFPVAPVDGSRNNYLSPCSFYEFDGNALARVTDPPNADCPTYVGRLLLLPSGEIFWAREDDTAMYVYQSTDAPNNAWRPAITNAPPVAVAGTTIAVSGTQFNGLSQAVGYGDDYTAATNYPLVRIRNGRSGRIRYCRTFNHTLQNGTTSMGIATGAAIVTTQVTIPADIEGGASELVVVANGIPSQPVKITIVEGDE